MKKEEIVKNMKELEDALQNATNDLELKGLIKLEIEQLNKYANENGFDISVSNSDSDNLFSMIIDDVFLINGRGTVVTGKIDTGFIMPGDEIEIIGTQGVKLITEIEIFKKIVDRGNAGDGVGLFLSNVNKDDIEKGMVVVKSQTIKTKNNSEFNSPIKSDVPFESLSPLENEYIDNSNSDNLNIILNKKNNLLKEINLLIEETDKVNEDINKQEDELNELEIQLKNIKNELDKLVNFDYSKNEIDKTIESTIVDIKALFNQHYNSDLINPNFYKEVKSKIFINNIESAIQGLTFKHHSPKIKAKGVFKSILFFGIAITLYYFAREFGMKLNWSLRSSNLKDYTVFGIFINSIAIAFSIYAFIVFIASSQITGRDLMVIINNNKSDNLSKKLFYLNSIHKLPKDVLQLINKN